ncbi:MAG: sigma-70 family RNA polymerase sigma factor [Cytophagales bacterium]|nr:sigma-70 family RNA polymerase sigma factor [Cytophagales bacterium]
MKQEEFIAIVKQHQKLIFKVCHLYGADEEQRKDLEQEILIQLWLSMERFRGASKLSTWIYRVAINTAITQTKKLNNYLSNLQRIDDTIINLQNDTSDSDHIDLLYRAIQLLGPTDKAMMMLYLDRLKHTEIAHIMGITPSNVATKIARIKNQLSKNINKLK